GIQFLFEEPSPLESEAPGDTDTTCINCIKWLWDINNSNSIEAPTVPTLQTQ
ncbi:hypothetical protein STEG23_000045, partial [Scotinomys teguina]